MSIKNLSDNTYEVEKNSPTTFQLSRSLTILVYQLLNSGKLCEVKIIISCLIENWDEWLDKTLTILKFSYYCTRLGVYKAIVAGVFLIMLCKGYDLEYLKLKLIELLLILLNKNTIINWIINVKIRPTNI
ncbi:hypothetical protein GQX74_004902 [Glossina fuscipes]|nr:hypothetical protein GQX74_004902 [Glossina fuscipes]